MTKDVETNSELKEKSNFCQAQVQLWLLLKFDEGLLLIYFSSPLTQLPTHATNRTSSGITKNFNLNQILDQLLKELEKICDGLDELHLSIYIYPNCTSK